MADINSSDNNNSNNTAVQLKDNGHTPFSNRTLFDIDFRLASCYVTLVALLSLVGVVGNALILVNMCRDKKLNRHTRKFIVNIALADLCVSGIANPMCIVGAFLGIARLNRDVWICVLIACMCLTACICVFVNLVCITVNRWVYICHNNVYDKIFKSWSTTVMCIMAWVLGFGAEFPNFLGWSGHFFDEKTHQCIWDRKSNRSYTLFVALGLITAPFLLLGYCNAAMFYTIWKGKRNAVGKKALVLSKSITSAKTLLIMYAVFLVCWTPYIVVLVADDEDTFSMETHLFVTLLAHSHSSTTFFVYVFGMREFQIKLLGMFHRRVGLMHQTSGPNIDKNLPTVTTVTRFIAPGGEEELVTSREPSIETQA